MCQLFRFCFIVRRIWNVIFLDFSHPIILWLKYDMQNQSKNIEQVQIQQSFIDFIIYLQNEVLLILYSAYLHRISMHSELNFLLAITQLSRLEQILGIQHEGFVKRFKIIKTLNKPKSMIGNCHFRLKIS